MTSKRLFANLLKENSKRRLVPIAASIACNFFAQIVFAILMMGRYEDRLIDGRTNISDVRADFFRNVAGVNSVPVLIIVTVLSIFIALQGYYYLFDSRQTDLYYSLPVRRQKIFDAFNLVGIFSFAIPYVVCHIIIVIVGLCRGYAEVRTIPMFMASAAAVILGYVLLYEFCVLAAVLTGHVVVASLGCAVFALLGPIVDILWDSLLETFFVSYISSLAQRTVLKMTPFSAVLDMGKALVGNNNEVVAIYPGKAAVPVVIVLVLIVGCFFLSRFLVDRRPAEAAGKSMAFEITKPVIKIIMMVVAAIGGGLVFYYTSEYGNLLIFGFGMVCAILVVHFAMETIFEFDFKASFGHFGSTAVGALISAAILLICVFDLFGYETWQPMPDRVASVSFSDDLTYSNLRCPIYRVDDTDDEYKFIYTVDNSQFSASKMKLTDIESVEKLTRQGAINARKQHNESRLWGARYYDNASDVTKEADYYTNVTVIWTMKNGKEIRRNYCIDLCNDELVDAYRKMFESKEYKLGKIPVLTMDSSEADEIYCDTVDGGYLEKISKDDLQGLIEAYEEDILKQSFDDITNEIPSVEIECYFDGYKRKYGDDISYNFYVYPSFVKTNEYLKKLDVPTSWRDGEENIKELTLGVTFQDDDDYHDEYYTTADKKEIANLLDNYYPAGIVNSSNSVSRELRENGLYFYDEQDTVKDVMFSTSSEGDRGGAESNGYIKYDEGLPKNFREFCFPEINEETGAANSGSAGWTTLVLNRR